MSLYDSTIDSLRAQRTRLEADLARWTKRTSKKGDLPLHQSQVIRLNDQISAAMSSALDGTPVRADTTAPHKGDVAELPYLRRAVGTVHLLWDFFRDKLAQRDMADYAELLAVADDLAWSCYEPFLEAARATGGLTADALKEPPLVFYSADRSPFSQARTKALHPPGLDSKDLERLTAELQRLPVPVIGMPWAVANRLPEVVLVGHEVGHVIAEDLKLASEVVDVICGLELAGDNDETRRGVWRAWGDEIFADVIGVLATGTAFVSGLAAELAGKKNDIEQAPINVGKPGGYPTPSLRIAVCDAVLSKIGVAAPGAWAGAYPFMAGDSRDYAPDVAGLVTGLCDRRWTATGNKLLVEVLPWGSKMEDSAAAVATAALRKAPAQVSFNVRVWVAAAMHAALSDPQGFERLGLDTTLSQTIIARRLSEGVRSSGSHRRQVLVADQGLTPDQQDDVLRSIDRQAGRDIADRLGLLP